MFVAESVRGTGMPGLVNSASGVPIVPVFWVHLPQSVGLCCMIDRVGVTLLSQTVDVALVERGWLAVHSLMDDVSSICERELTCESPIA